MKTKLCALLLVIANSLFAQEWKKVRDYDALGLTFDGKTIYGVIQSNENSIFYTSSSDQGLTWRETDMQHPDTKGKGCSVLYFQPPYVFTHTNYSGIINSSFDMGKTWSSFQLKDYHPTVELNTDKIIVKTVRKAGDDFYAVCMKGIMKFNKENKSWAFAQGLKGHLDRDYEDDYGVKVYNKAEKYVDIAAVGDELIVIETDMDYKNTILSSVDNGVTWTKKLSNFSNSPCSEANQFEFISSGGKLYFWGIEGCLLASDDKGSSFKELKTITEYVNVVYPGEILVVGGYSDATGYKPEVAYSTNNGATFTKLKVITSSEDKPHGLICINKRIIVATAGGIWVYNL